MTQLRTEGKVREDQCCMLKSGVLFKRETHMHIHTEACTLTDQEELPHLYPSLWQQSLPQDRDQFNFKHHFYLVPALYFLLSLLLAACLSQLGIICSVGPLFPAKEPEA